MSANSYRDKVLAAIPTNWLDPLLTGPNAALRGLPWECPEIEALLVGIRKRIEAIPFPDGPSREDLLAAAEQTIHELQDGAEQFEWLLDDPGLACLIFAESTNTDTYGLRRDAEVTLPMAKAYIRERIQELREQERTTATSAPSTEEKS
jgi:hypothetical protein